MTTHIDDKHVDDQGTVQIVVDIDAPRAAVWQAITEPEHVRAWLGVLDRPLVPGASVKLDFEDGDFFLIDDIHVEPSRSLQHTWRFMGTGPLDRIKWRLTDRDSGCRLEVTDREASRARGAAEELYSGWRDFTGRLVGYLSGPTRGQPQRYDLRALLEVSIELAARPEDAWEMLLSPGAQPRWLPTAGLVQGAQFGPASDGELRQFRVADVRIEVPARIKFRLEESEAVAGTRCQLELEPAPTGTMLSVAQDGWAQFSPNLEVQRNERRRFSAFWIGAVRRAQSIIAAASLPLAASAHD